MKKFITIVVILLLCFALCSCNSKKEENYQAAIEAAEEQNDFEIAIAKLEKYPDYKDSQQRIMDYTYAYCLDASGFANQYQNPDILNTTADEFVKLYTQISLDFVKSNQAGFEDALFRLQELIDAGYCYNAEELQKALSELIAMCQ